MIISELKDILNKYKEDSQICVVIGHKVYPVEDVIPVTNADTNKIGCMFCVDKTWMRQLEPMDILIRSKGCD